MVHFSIRIRENLGKDSIRTPENFTAVPKVQMCSKRNILGISYNFFIALDLKTAFRGISVVTVNE